MKFQLVVFDLDGVLVDVQSSWVWVHEYFGVDNRASLRDYVEGRIDDIEFMRRDIALWRSRKKELHISDIENILSTVPLMVGALETISTLKSAGLKTAIVSGGLELLARRVARETGIDMYVANGLKLDSDGYLMGEGDLKVKLKDKGESLKGLLDSANIRTENCVAVGNSFIDIGLFENSGLGIAFNPCDTQVRERADVVVESKDLRAILEHILA